MPEPLAGRLRRDARGRILTIERVLLDAHAGRALPGAGPWFADLVALLVSALLISGLRLRRLRRQALLAALAIATAATSAVADTSDWRKDTAPPDKIDKLVEAMPGAATLMIEMGQRYQNLYWAAKLGKWEFAAYQAEEMSELLTTLSITRPRRAESAAAFLTRMYPALPEAIQSRNWKRFSATFETLRQECMACHAHNDVGFIRFDIPRRASSPVLNLH